MGCISSRPPPNPEEVDLTHFLMYGTVGKGGFGKVNAVMRTGPLAVREEKNKFYALKRMSKEKVISSKANFQMIWTERDVMNIIRRLNSPFLCSLVHAFQAEAELYLVMDFMQGGDLRYQLNQLPGRLMKEEVCVFYAAQMVLGLEALHSLNICYRDMKPENALLDREGNLRLSDFGISECLKADNGYQTRGRCGTFGYQAPEMLLRQPYGLPVDFWAFGITVYEMLHGQMMWDKMGDLLSTGIASTGNMYVDVTFREIEMLSNFHISKRLSPAARSFVQALLTIDPQARLGSGANGWNDVKNHEFFRGVDWAKVASREIKPPITPKDTANNTGIAAATDILLDDKPMPISEEDNRKFIGFECNVDLKKLLSELPPEKEKKGGGKTARV